ncbi:glycoside hydrolase family 127 protein [Silvimonas iriomotensis]|uniref:Glycoside hydrolase family 127 protein n=1 Tax=Silvimonas iriomotensis TaxID=449662 RepID=A0ABQ2P725_9NEIS|nr:beta-L-arabinofuranosidase domain-containing protein [Silvimonas iriomotensis]GGP19285.1 hypothetical protein GCM10010970_09850 [Silvimonas iriomotensis]
MQVHEVNLQGCVIDDPLLGQYQALVRDVVIPYQWAALNDQIPEAEPSHAIDNFRIAAGQKEGTFYGMVFQDSDVAKWLEAVAWSLVQQPDPGLEKTADEVIALIAAAQQADGYLNTWFTVKAPEQRWSNLAECHELYCAGHLIEAGVAWFGATGKRQLLEIVCKLADHIDQMFGPEPDQLQGYPGHPEIELALVRLYEVTQEQRYLQLARFFVEQRGAQPHYYDIESDRRGGSYFWPVHGPAWMIKDKAYSQAHLPLAQQNTATGHAVRFVYLLAGVAHLARLCGDEEKRQTCVRLWQNMVERQLYITGGIGAQSHGESFSTDYDLPNDTAYAESCASVGLMMFARRMIELEGESHYADVMEKALYNTVLGGMALDGKHYFYVNPLEVHPATLASNHIHDHVKPVRQRWFGCACCPPNIARLLTSLGHYIYTRRDDVVLVNLYVGNVTTLGDLRLHLHGNYPQQENIRIVIEAAPDAPRGIALRIPDWCSNATWTVNGDELSGEHIKGYVHLRRVWRAGDEISLHLPMAVRRVYGHPQLRHVAGKVAVQRGPLVYCLEQADNGPALHNLRLPPDSVFGQLAGEGALAGLVLLQAKGLKHARPSHTALYAYDTTPQTTPVSLIFIPWFAWANRGEGEMCVWVREH